MCSTVCKVSRHKSDSIALTSSSASQDNVPCVRDILAAISDDKSLVIFRIIAELNNTGGDSRTIRIKLSLTRKEYYYRLAVLIQNGLIIKKDRNKKYILTLLGKVVYNNLLSIQYALINIWKFRAIDAVRISNDRIYEDVDKIASGLTELLIHEEQIKEILLNCKKSN
jgi:predicted transcriptional regulator